MMSITRKITHPWDLDPAAAIALQRELAAKVIRETTFGPVTTIAGVDASYRDGIARSAVVAFSFPDMDILEYVTAERPVSYPYVPGLLSFREAPAVLDSLEKLPLTLDLLIFDGHGIAHPRRLGIASHIGLLVDVPSIGCAKKRLVGHYDEPARERGSFTYLHDGDETIGAVVRTRTGVKPVFVSTGHRISLDAAIDVVLVCGRGYRLPEPTRWADKIAGGVCPPS
jgi:deoxyribonuclease V